MPNSSSCKESTSRVRNGGSERSGGLESYRWSREEPGLKLRSRNSRFGISFTFPIKVPRTFYLTCSFQRHTDRICVFWGMTGSWLGPPQKSLFWDYWLALKGIRLWGRRFGQNEQTLGGDKGQDASQFLYSCLPCLCLSSEKREMLAIRGKKSLIFRH